MSETAHNAMMAGLGFAIGLCCWCLLWLVRGVVRRQDEREHRERWPNGDWGEPEDRWWR